MTDRFDLEDKIMSCWNVVEDVRLVASECEHISDPKVADRIQNALLGICTIYDMKFNKLEDIFSELVQDGTIK